MNTIWEITNVEAILVIVRLSVILFKRFIKWNKNQLYTLAGVYWFILFSIIYSATFNQIFAIAAVAGAVGYSLFWAIREYGKKR